MELLKLKFIEKLKSTQRDGIDNVIAELNRLGFFKAPASSRFHLNVEGGLMQHSWNVCTTALMLREQMIQMNPEIADRLPEESVIIASLLHDTCKSDIYKKTIVSRKDDNGFWVQEPGYSVDNSNLPLGHGEKSVIMLLSWGLKLTRDEMLAIRWHMTAWDLPFQSYEHKTSLEAARKTAPLCYIIQCADSLSSGILES
jgi:hypothetical protein